MRFRRASLQCRTERLRGTPSDVLTPTALKATPQRFDTRTQYRPGEALSVLPVSIGIRVSPLSPAYH
jgi:hypothetical protein